MKARRTSTKVKNTSKRNKSVRKAIREGFPSMRNRVYAEYPYSKIINILKLELDRYRAGQVSRLKADVFIRDYFVVIEAMGEQHYKPVAFGGDMGIASDQFEKQLVRDKMKRTLAIESDGGFKIIELPYYISEPDALGWLSIIHQVACLGLSSVYLIGEDLVVPIDEDGEQIANGEIFNR